MSVAHLFELSKRSQNHIVNMHYSKHVSAFRKIKTSTNSRSMQCFDFLDISSFRFIYFPHRLAYYAFSYNLVIADSKKIRVCRRIYARSRGKRVLEASLMLYPNHTTGSCDCQVLMESGRVRYCLES